MVRPLLQTLTHLAPSWGLFNLVPKEVLNSEFANGQPRLVLFWIRTHSIFLKR